MATEEQFKFDIAEAEEIRHKKLNALISVIAVAGDMYKSVYDPNLVEADTFNMENMIEGVNNLILTQAERDRIANELLELTGGTMSGTLTISQGGNLIMTGGVGGTGTFLYQGGNIHDGKLQIFTDSGKMYLEIGENTNPEGDLVIRGFSGSNINTFKVRKNDIEYSVLDELDSTSFETSYLIARGSI